MLQTIILILIFAIAVLYLGRRLLRQYMHPDSCGTAGCAKCGSKEDVKNTMRQH